MALSPRKEEWAACKIQAAARGKRTQASILEVARRVYELGYHLESRSYFYFNKHTGSSSWEKPRLLRAWLPYRVDRKAERAAIKMQSVFRRRLARKRRKTRLTDVFRKEYDPESKAVYYLNQETNQVQWEAPAKEDCIDFTQDSKALYNRDREIEDLKMKLAQKEKEIENVKTQRYEELASEVRLKKMADALRGKKRSKLCENWAPEHCAAWFMDLGLDEHVPALLKSRVNGLLLLNMDDQDFEELGITRKIHLKKIQVNLKKYRNRYDDGDGGDVDDDDEDEEPSQIEDTVLEEGDDDDSLLPTEEELFELQRDRANLDIKVVFPGDEKTYPDVGDIVRCHLVCRLLQKDIELENTRKKKQPFEFVLGVGHVIRGIDRAVLQMSYGERANITVSPLYAYADLGMPPLIPPDAPLLFDVELLKWRTRPIWVKPLIQDPGLTEYPYEDDDDTDPNDTDRLFSLPTSSSEDDTTTFSSSKS